MKSLVCGGLYFTKHWESFKLNLKKLDFGLKLEYIQKTVDQQTADIQQLEARKPADWNK